MLQLLVGLLYLVAGFIIADAPVKSAAVFTLLLAGFFVVGGVFPNCVFFDGAISSMGMGARQRHRLFDYRRYCIQELSQVCRRRVNPGLLDHRTRYRDRVNFLWVDLGHARVCGQEYSRG